MQNEFFLILQLIATAVFFAALYAGYYLIKNHRRLFGVDPDIPSEVSSSRSYLQMYVFAILAHVVFGSAAFALLLH